MSARPCAHTRRVWERTRKNLYNENMVVKLKNVSMVTQARRVDAGTGGVGPVPLMADVTCQVGREDSEDGERPFLKKRWDFL